MAPPKRRLTPEERRELEEQERELRARRQKELAGAAAPPPTQFRSRAPAPPRSGVGRAPAPAPAADAPSPEELKRRRLAERQAKLEEEQALRSRRAREILGARNLQRARGTMMGDDNVGDRRNAPKVSERLRELFGSEPVELPPRRNHRNKKK
jgi:hypothetical protein